MGTEKTHSPQPSDAAVTGPELDIRVADDERHQAPGHGDGKPEAGKQGGHELGSDPGGPQWAGPVPVVSQEPHGRGVQAFPDGGRVPVQPGHFERGEEQGHGEHQMAGQLVGVIRVVPRAGPEGEHGRHAVRHLGRGHGPVRVNAGPRPPAVRV